MEFTYPLANFLYGNNTGSFEYHGYKLTNIDFFKTHNFFTKIWVVNDLSDIDISGVHYLNANH